MSDWNVEVGQDAIVRHKDGRSINCGDAIYHPENVVMANKVAAVDDLLEALEAMIIGAAACAIPHPAERAVLQEAVNMAISAKRKAKGIQ